MKHERVETCGRVLEKIYDDNDNFLCWRELLTCSRCNKEFIQPTEGHYNLYCEECAPIVRREKTKERTRRYRERKKLEASL